MVVTPVLLVEDGGSTFFVGELEPAVTLANKTRTIVRREEGDIKIVSFQDSDGYVSESGYADTYEAATRYALGALFSGRDEAELLEALSAQE